MRRILLVVVAAVAAPVAIAAGVAVATAVESPNTGTSTPTSAVPSPQPTPPAIAPPSPPPSPAASTPTPVTAEVVLHGPRSANKVALTFDADLSDWALSRVRDGRYPEQVNTEVLEELESTTTAATVFVTGLWAEEYPAAMRRIAGNPRLELANHTFNHDAWTENCYGLPTVEGQASKTAEVTRTAEIIRSYTGSFPTFFRFPGLCHSQQDVDLVAALGETSVDVDVETSDAFAEDADRTASGILSEIRPGSIVLFHLNGGPNAPATAQIVRELLPALKARGLQPVTLTELLRQP